MENGSRNYQYKRTWAIWHRLQGQMVVSSMLSLKRWQPVLCSSEAGGQATSLITRKAGNISHELRALGKDVGSRMLVASLGVIDSRWQNARVKRWTHKTAAALKGLESKNSKIANWYIQTALFHLQFFEQRRPLACNLVQKQGTHSAPWGKALRRTQYPMCNIPRKMHKLNALWLNRQTQTDTYSTKQLTHTLKNNGIKDKERTQKTHDN